MKTLGNRFKEKVSVKKYISVFLVIYLFLDKCLLSFIDNVLNINEI